MQALDVLQGCVRHRWIDQGFGKAPLILSGQTEDGLFLNRSLCSGMDGTDDEIRETAPLQFHRSFRRGIAPCG